MPVMPMILMMILMIWMTTKMMERAARQVVLLWQQLWLDWLVAVRKLAPAVWDCSGS